MREDFHFISNFGAVMTMHVFCLVFYDEIFRLLFMFSWKSQWNFSKDNIYPLVY